MGPLPKVELARMLSGSRSDKGRPYGHPSVAGTPYRVGNGREQLRPLKWLGEEAGVASTKGRQSLKRVGVTGDEDDRQLGVHRVNHS